MWDKSYRDYRPWDPLIKYQLKPSKGLRGCEMHDINGWGNEFQSDPPRKKGWLTCFFKRKK